MPTATVPTATVPTTTVPSDLFRREALEYRSRQRGPGVVLQVGAPWVRRLYRVGLALVAAGLALLFLIRVQQSTSGPALVDPRGQTFVAALPAASDVPVGRHLHLQVEGAAGPREIAGTVLRVVPADDPSVRRAGFGSFPRPAVLVTGILAPGAATRTGTSPGARLHGRAVVPLGSERLSSLVLHGFDASGGGVG
jgi:hypothetical protein